MTCDFFLFIEALLNKFVIIDIIKCSVYYYYYYFVNAFFYFIYSALCLLISNKKKVEVYKHMNNLNRFLFRV
jgi:hypothetical protein